MPATPLKNILAFTLEKIPDEPRERQVGLYRDVATLCGDEKAALGLLSLADDLEEFDRRHRQLQFDLE